MKKLETTSLVDQIYTILWQEIVQRNLKPNTKVDINQLAQELDVSRTPVVDALLRLEIDGLVTRRNRVGTFVTPLEKSSLIASFQSREMVEQYITPFSIRNMNDDDIVALQDSLAALARSVDTTDPQSFDYGSYTRHDNDFHIKLVEMADNNQILDFYKSLNSHMQIARAYSRHAYVRAADGLKEHQDIFEAFLAGDVYQARLLQRIHLEKSRDGVLKTIDEHGFL